MYARNQVKEILTDLSEVCGDFATDQLIKAIENCGPATVDRICLHLEDTIKRNRPKQGFFFDALGLDRLAMERHREQRELERGRITAIATGEMI